MITRKTPFGEYYIIRRTAKKIWREWFLVKYQGTAKTGAVNLGTIRLPPELLGKRIAFKIEVFDDEKAERAQEGRDILEDNSRDIPNPNSGVDINKISGRRKKDSN